MAIRRRRKTLTNLLSSMERRVTSVELRPINLLTTAQVAGATSSEEEDLDQGPDSVVALNAPNQYKPIVDGYFYSANVTGGKPLVELYFESNPGLETNKTIRISGVNKLRHNSTAVDFDISKDYKTIAIDTEPYTGRDSYGGERHTPPSTVDSTAMFNVSTGLTYSDAKQLIVSRRIATVEATTTTAKIVFTFPNYFKQGQVVYVGMPTDSVYYGRDGLFRVKEAGSNFITYDFDAAIPEPINIANVTEERYVNAVAQSAVRDGATWFDSSQDPDVAYVWDDYRWVLFGSSTVTKDTKKPADVENLSASDDNDTPPGSTSAQSRVTLTWDAPSTNQDGSPLDDLIGYTIWSRQYEGGAWDKVDVTGLETEWAKSGFIQGQPAYFKVFARDSGGNRSEGVDLTYTTGTFAPEVATPKAPTVTTYLGTIKIAYDDLTSFGLVQAASAKEIEVYFSDVDGFTPGPTNYYGKFPANRGSYIIIPGTELVQNKPLEDGTDYYVKIKVRDIYENVTEPSAQVAVRVKLSNIVTFDMIDVGTLTGQVIIGLDIRTSSNPSVSGGIIMNQQGLTAYNTAGKQTFSINAQTGGVIIGDYLGRDEAAGLFLATNVADGKYATKPSDGTFITDIQAGSIFLSQQSASTNYITKLDAGTLYIGKGKGAEDINNNSTTINGGKITTGTLNANRIGAGSIDASLITITDLTASNINRGTMTGRPIQTAGSGKRIVLSAANSRIDVFATSSQSGFIQGESTGVVLSSSGSDCAVEVRPAAVVISGTTTNNRATFTGSGNYIFSGPRRTEGGSFIVDVLSGVVSKSYVFAESSGSIYSSTSTVGVSDARLKKSITPSPVGLDLVKKLNPVTFKWDEIELGDAEQNPQKLKTQLGLIAQQVQGALEELGLGTETALVGKFENQDFYKERLTDTDIDSEPILALDYLQLVPVLIKSIQELSARIENLETEREN